MGDTLRRVKNIVILISGRGSNMQALVTACQNAGAGARVVAVISNRPDAAGLAWAAERGLVTDCVDHRTFADRASFDAALRERIDACAPDFVLLAGFMRILTAGFVAHYEGRLVNIHPSLLPAFAGLATHEKALAAGVRVHGATVHFVTPDLDHGPIIAQAVVAVLPGDDAQSLAARVLEQEHRLYPLALRWLIDGRIELKAGRACFNGPAEPALLCGC
jgi:phosphoribosylglycinamide formyltransferase-1